MMVAMVGTKGLAWETRKAKGRRLSKGGISFLTALFIMTKSQRSQARKEEEQLVSGSLRGDRSLAGHSQGVCPTYTGLSITFA